MAESVLFQALVKIRDYLREVSADGGTTYWTTPRTVEIVSTWNDPVLWRDGASPSFGVRLGDAIHREDTTGGGMRVEADVFVLVAARTENERNVVRDVQRMLRDVKRRLLDPAIVTLGGLVFNVATGSDGIVESPAYFEEQSWIGSEMTFRLSATYLSSAP